MQTVLVNEKEYRLKQTTVSKREEEFGHSYWTKEYGWLVGVTTILGMAIPPSQGLIHFWKNTDAQEADERFTLAGEAGTRVHQTLEALLLGESVPSRALITTKEKRGVSAFIDWFRVWKPTESQSEQVVAHINMDKGEKFAGTLDLLCKINGEWVVIDFKTGNKAGKSHLLQVSAYAGAIEQSYGIKVTRKFVLYLGTLHKVAGRKTNDLGLPTTGPGWSIEESHYSFDDYLKAYHYALFLNDGYPEPPTIQVFPETFQLLEEISSVNATNKQEETANETVAEAM